MKTYNELVADFRKPDFIKSADYVKSRRQFIKASQAQKTQTFLTFCAAVIKQKNNGELSVREAAYAISICDDQGLKLNNTIDAIIKEALHLRRHPEYYKEDHEAGWKTFIKNINTIRKYTKMRQHKLY